MRVARKVRCRGKRCCLTAGHIGKCSPIAPNHHPVSALVVLVIVGGK